MKLNFGFRRATEIEKVFFFFFSARAYGGTSEWFLVATLSPERHPATQRTPHEWLELGERYTMVVVGEQEARGVHAESWRNLSDVPP
jgi:hypothetical protein